MDDLFGLSVTAALFGVPIVYIVVQVRAARRMHGAFRLAAMIPLPGWGVWLTALMSDVARDPTSHNLWPFEILVGALLATLYLACPWVASSLLTHRTL